MGKVDSENSRILSTDCERYQNLTESLILDDGLTQDQTLFLKEHASQCTPCRVFSNALGFIKENVDELDLPIVSNLKTQLCNQATWEIRKKWFYRVSIPVAIGVACVILWFVLLLDNSHFAPTLVEKSSNPILQTGMLVLNDGTRVMSGNRIPYGEKFLVEKHIAILTLGNYGRVVLQPSTKGVFYNHATSHVVFGLDQASMKIELDPRALVRFTVRTPHCNITAKGTQFFVETTVRSTRVDMLEGVTEIISNEKTSIPIWLYANMSYESHPRSIHKLDHQRLVWMQSFMGMQPPTTFKKNTGADSILQYQSAKKSKWTNGIGSEVEHPKTPSVNPSDNQPHIDVDLSAQLVNLLNEANKARRSRNWTEALRIYQQIVMQHPDDLASKTSLIAIAEIEIEQMQKPDQALRHYEQYLQIAPHGPLAPEALMGKANALRKLQRFEEEKVTLQQFVRTYETHIYAQMANERLRQLGGGDKDNSSYSK